MDLLARWLRKYGRPVALYTGRHSIFEPQDKGQALPDAQTQFGRALGELDIRLVRARSPQAKGRVERGFGTAQDRWVKELRLAGASTAEQANAVLARLLPWHNRRFAVPPARPSDAHRELGPGHDLDATLSVQEERVVSNDYTIRFANRFYQLLKPALPGLRGGRVTVELRLSGAMAVRFRGRYLRYQEVEGRRRPGGSAPRPPEFTAQAADARGGEEEGVGPAEGPNAPGVQPAGGRSGRTPAEPYPPDGGAENSARPKRRPAENHPWREPFNRKK